MNNTKQGNIQTKRTSQVTVILHYFPVNLKPIFHSTHLRGTQIEIIIIIKKIMNLKVSLRSNAHFQQNLQHQTHKKTTFTSTTISHMVMNYKEQLGH